jgi:hypothetical protein
MPSLRSAGVKLSSRVQSTVLGPANGMASEKQRKAARHNVKKAQAGAKRKQTLKNRHAIARPR